MQSLEGADAKQLFQQAQSQLSSAQSVYNQGTLADYKDAYSKAQQATSYADQAIIKEQAYQQQKQQQLQNQQVAGVPLVIIGLVAGGLVLVIVIVAVMMRRARKPQTPKTLP